jgi:hypothetical protein
MSSHQFENDNHDDNHTSSEHDTQENENHNLSTTNPGIQGTGGLLENLNSGSLSNTTGNSTVNTSGLENHSDSSSEQHAQDNDSGDHNLSTANSGTQGNGSVNGNSLQNTTGGSSTTNSGIQGDGSLEKIIAAALQNRTGTNAMNSNELESHDSNAPSEQHTQEGQKDSEGYEYHYSSATTPEVHGSNTVGNVLKGSNSDDLLYGGVRNDVLDGSDGNDRLEGSDGDDILVGGANTDKGENHLNGGNGDDILVAGGSKTSQLDQFLANHQDIVNSVKSDQKLTDVAAIINSVTNNTSNSSHNIFDVHSGSGHDQIFNFHAATDKVQLDRGLNGSDIRDINSLLNHIHISGNDLSIDLGGGNSIMLVGVDVSGLSANNVAFA